MRRNIEVDWRIVLHCLLFSFPDALLYFNSFNKYDRHIHESAPLLTEASTTSEEITLALVVLGALCTLIANVPAYYARIKAYETKTEPEDNENKLVLFSVNKDRLIALISTINKSIAAAASFQALLHDYPPTSSVTSQSIGFSLAAAGNFLAQFSVQMSHLYKAKWREEGCIQSLISRLIIPLKTILYNGPLHVMYWNAISNDADTLGGISRISLSRETLDDPVKRALALGGAPLLLIAAINTQVRYTGLIRESFFKSQRKKSAPSCSKKFMGLVNGLQRTLFMFLALVCFLYDCGLDHFAAWAVSGLFVYSIGKANHSLLYPYEVEEKKPIFFMEFKQTRQRLEEPLLLNPSLKTPANV